MIADVHIAFNNYLQDMGQKFDNFSTITWEDGTQTQATASDELTWKWYRYTTGPWTKTLIDVTFHLFIAPNVLELCNGEMILELEATHADGRKWSAIIPVFLQHYSIEQTCDSLYMPQAGLLSAQLWREQRFGHVNFAPKIPFQDLKSGVKGDLNGDGAVNISDLLIFATKFEGDN